MKQPLFSRHWAMPNADTFSIPVIGDWVKRRLAKSKVSIDPFSRNKRWATHTNDLNPETEAEHHMEARDFLRMLVEQGVKADLIIFDPPLLPTTDHRVLSRNWTRRIHEGHTERGSLHGMPGPVLQTSLPRLRGSVIRLELHWNGWRVGDG